MSLPQTETNISAKPSTADGATAWGVVLLAIGAGLLCGAQLGKAHISLPSIRNSFSLSLVDASWILSALSLESLDCLLLMRCGCLCMQAWA